MLRKLVLNIVLACSEYVKTLDIVALQSFNNQGKPGIFREYGGSGKNGKFSPQLLE